jgi:amino acid adenylation domain-containing protein/non-ribosomal peptide synthase protein (TIGR01720 family)
MRNDADEGDFLRQRERIAAGGANLLTDFPRPPSPAFRRRRVSLRLGTAILPGGLVQGRDDFSLFISLLSAIAAVICRMGRGDGVLLGSLSSASPADCPRAAATPLQRVWIPIDGRREMSGSQFQAAVASAVSRVRSHLDQQAEPRQESLPRPLSAAGASPARILFALLDEPSPLLGTPLRSAELSYLQAELVDSDLVLIAQRHGESLRLRCDADAELFCLGTIRRFLPMVRRQWIRMLRHPAARIDQAPLIGRSQTARLLAIAHGPDVIESGASTIHEWFQRSAAVCPDTIAIESPTEQIRYGELNSQSNRLAQQLRELGVRDESIVAIGLERSVSFVIASLAVLKCGAAYVPIDPRHPDVRRNRMLRTASADLALVATPLLPDWRSPGTRLPGTEREKSVGPLLPGAGPWGASHKRGPTLFSRTILGWDQAISRLPQYADAPPPSSAGAKHAAYLLYTSGTTGTAKGVVVEHRNLVNLIHWHHRRYPTGVGERVGQTSSISFDASVWEIWSALTCGASLVLLDESASAVPETLADWFSDQRLAHCFLATRLTENLLQRIPLQGLPLRTLLTGGERLDPIPQADLGDVRLVNHYGVTEAAVVSSCTDVGDAIHSDRPSIGRPIDNTQVYLLDEHGRLAPPGAVGEISIGGQGVARGYHGQPRMTAERYLPDPFATRPGQRLYRTGDLGRYRVDGRLEYLGRCDRQVQLRGVRVEPGEIEATLLAYPGVRQAAVVAIPPGDRASHLVAFVVTADTSIDTDAIASHAERSLPQPMVPRQLVRLDALPTTSHGKIDYPLLARQASGLAERPCQTRPPGPKEQALIEIWSNILGRPQVGVGDNFFSLGGDSILAIQCVSAARARGIRLRPDQFVRFPTIAQLAVIACSDGSAERALPACTGPAPLTPIQAWLIAGSPSTPKEFTQTMCFQVRSSFTDAQWSWAWDRLVRHHDALRLRVQGTPPNLQQHVVAEETRAILNIIDAVPETAAQRRQREKSIAQQLRQRIDLAGGPILQAALMRMPEQRADQLIVVIHHCAVDGVSWQILIEDLAALLECVDAAEAGRRLPTTGTSYLRWAHHLAHRASSGADEHQRDYWRRQFPSSPVPLPRDFQVTHSDGGFQRSVSIRLDPVRSKCLHWLAPQLEGHGPLASLVAATACTLAGWSGQTCAWFELEGHGRVCHSADQDLSRTVGWFTARFPFLVACPGAVSLSTEILSELVDAVNQRLGEIPDGGLGFGILSLPPSADDWPALPEVRLNYLGQLDRMFPPERGYRLLRRSLAPDRGPHDRRPHLFEIDAAVLRGCLQIDWTYGADAHRRETVVNLAKRLRAVLEHLADHYAAGGHRPGNDERTSKLAPSELQEMTDELRRWNG